ncbi:MAG: two-component system response regulator [Acidimicrobiales bacterium]|nr:two-component system response regulator [Acidimicrobiales bacterium]
MIRVLIVDDQAMVRAGFRMIIEAEPDITVVGEAADGIEALERAARSAPDVVLMDVRMPRMDGIEAAAQLLAGRDADNANGTPRVLMLTTFDLDDYVYSALRAGVSGFMLKDAPAEQLVEAIRVIAAGDALLAPSVTRRLIEDFSRRPTREVPTPAPGLDQLTEREHEVLRLVAKGMSNAEIADQLYLGEATIKTHVGRMLMKLRLRDRVQAVVLAYESGLITPGDQTVV